MLSENQKKELADKLLDLAKKYSSQVHPEHRNAALQKTIKYIEEYT